MNTQPEGSRKTLGPLLVVIALAVFVIVALILAHAINPAPTTSLETSRPAESPEATSEDVHRLCGACHAYPPPDTFPRLAWRKEVKQGYDFFHQDLKYRFDYPPLESVVRYYERRAPEEFPFAMPSPSPSTPPFQFERTGYRVPEAASSPGVAHVSLVRLFSKDPKKLDILVCDALSKQVLVLSTYEPTPTWRIIAQGVCCAHAEVVDLDGDGIDDVVLACLGSFYATDDRVGSVVWLKGAADGTFKPITLLDGMGRVADVRAADFRGNGKLDVVVAEFGWHKTGSILRLENQTTDWTHPVFTPHVIDDRHGTTHVPVVDLNGDGRPDFVAVISQEHETVVAFLNEGNGRFRQETIYVAPHPSFGCNGVQVVDLDGDGDLDVLLTNGDSLDAPYLLKPYHGNYLARKRGTLPVHAAPPGRLLRRREPGRCRFRRQRSARRGLRHLLAG